MSITASYFRSEFRLPNDFTHPIKEKIFMSKFLDLEFKCDSGLIFLYCIIFSMCVYMCVCVCVCVLVAQSCSTFLHLYGLKSPGKNTGSHSFLNYRREEREKF